jgi:CxxC-x17-CxxC domain-containing protein
MIDGVSSRPFSAKTLPPLAKSGNKEIEDEVIKSSRALYCKSREVVEREINNWSGMSIGSDTDAGGVEKFPAVCSICKKDTMVPFKPEPGRAVYCKDCIAKIKSGEVKPVAGSIKQIKQDETKFFKPLADLGIEFENKDHKVVEEENERYPQRVDKVTIHETDKKIEVKNIPIEKPRIFSAIKKVFTPSFVKDKVVKPASTPVKDHSGLKEVLDKALSQNKAPTPVSVPIPPPVSLNTLKIENNKGKTTNDRSANAEDMNKLKDFIETKNISSNNVPDTKKEVPEIKQDKEEPARNAFSIADAGGDKKVEASTPTSKSKVKEVPEDVLRKILE